MNASARFVIVGALAVTVIATIVLKQSKTPPASESVEFSTAPLPNTNRSTSEVAAKLPRLVDVGAGKCVPCKLMAPILDEFRRAYADQFVTEIIDVWENPAAGQQYGVEIIPTQIFFDGEGKELFRHVGFFGREEMLGKWKELGVDVTRTNLTTSNKQLESQ